MKISIVFLVLFGLYSPVGAFAPKLSALAQTTHMPLFAKSGNTGDPDSVSEDVQRKVNAGKARAEMDLSKVQESAKDNAADAGNDAEHKKNAVAGRAAMDARKTASKIDEAIEDIQTKRSAVQSRAEMDGRKVRENLEETVDDIKTKAEAAESRAEMDIKKVKEGTNFNS